MVSTKNERPNSVAGPDYIFVTYSSTIKVEKATKFWKITISDLTFTTCRILGGYFVVLSEYMNFTHRDNVLAAD